MPRSHRSSVEQPDPKRAGKEPEGVRISLLGGFRVSVGSRTIEEGAWRLRKAASLVKLLALAPGHRLHRERVMDLLWPDSGTEAASNNLRYALHQARRTLEPEAGSPERYLGLQGEQLTLCPGGQLWVDVEAFEDAAAIARRSREPAAYRAAIELYVGELLPEDRYEEWAEQRRAQLREAYLDLLVGLARSHEERAEYEKGIEALRKAVAEEPTHQEAHTGLMRLYAFSGRRVDALGQYHRLEEILSEHFGTKPGSETPRLREEIASGRFPMPTSPPEEHPLEEHAAAHNLPLQRTSFIGREREMVELKRLLSMTGMLTLTGAGGAGKTRLALEVGRELASVYPDGVWLVELAPLSDSELVAGQLARALSVSEEPDRPLIEMLVEHLCKKKVLVIVDNCEHLLDTAAHLADTLLSTCPRLKILATSREPLGVASEATWAVPSLSVPGEDHLPGAEDLARYESVRLFVDRARAKLAAFALTSENTGSVAKICQKLDGVPLAIELAAARMDVLAPEQVAERLDRALGLLTGGSLAVEPRHRTLRATLDWGYELLGEPERKLFGRLSVFAGGFTLEAAEAVGAGEGIEEGEVLELFLMLVDKSLVVTDPDGKGSFRYGMLEPIRQYAREKLEESGEAEAVRRRHVEWYLALAELAEQELTGPRQAQWLERLEREHDNLRAALLWSLETDLETGARLAGTLYRFWWVHGHLSEGRRWLDRALARPDELSASVRARALRGAGVLAAVQNDYERSVPLMEESLALTRELGDKYALSRVLGNLGTILSNRGEYERAREVQEESLALDRELGDKYGTAVGLGSLGELAYLQGDYEAARAYWEECLPLHRDLKDSHSVAITLNNLGEAVRNLGEYGRASELFEESLRRLRELDAEYGIATTLLNLADVLMEQRDYGRVRALLGECLSMSRTMGKQDIVADCLEILAELATIRRQPERAARLFGAAEALREAIGSDVPRLNQRPGYERSVSVARSQLDETAFAAAWAQGKTMTPEEAIECGLPAEELAPPTPRAPEQPPATEPPHKLTRREAQVAALVARGLTNRQIASELSISEHTVAAHVAKILKKLGLRSRSQLPPG